MGERLGPGAKSPATLVEDTTRTELYDRATELDIEGRSSMNKGELAAAIAEAEANGAASGGTIPPPPPPGGDDEGSEA